MVCAPDLHLLVDGFAAKLEALELSGEDQEEYSTVLCQLESQADRDEPSWAIVLECIDYLACFSTRKEARRPAA